ncbi:MAG: Bug family tripartite tricarboxylate transporter substrate binding protein [Beijerinckiaceae bacterium]
MKKGLLALALAAVTLGGASAQADGSFKGKTVRIIVGYGPGGGYDTYARMLAPHFAKKLDTTVIVENQPGAGGLNALNRLYAGKPDGVTMMLVNGTAAALSQLAGMKAVRYDLGKMGSLGTVAKSPWIWLVHKDYPIKTAQEALDSGKEIRWAAGGLIDGLGDGARFTCAALKLKCNVVIGYKGSNDASRAVMQGEMDALYVSDTSAFNYSKTGNVRAIAVMNRKPSRFFPNVKPIYDQVKLTKDGEWLLDFHSTVEDLGRILVVAPNTPAKELKALQDATKAVLTDKDVVAQGEKGRRYIEFVDAETTLKNIKTVVDVTPQEKERIRKVLHLN